jgi:cyclopropane fatty-acyl-phospholipid synthase-like methyltransferase
VHIADLFTWDTDERFDSVVFTFWISHVPRERLDAFFASVGRWLRPGGTLFFIDNLLPATAAPPARGVGDQLTVRRLNDGRQATIVKNSFSAETLRHSAAAAGLDLDIRSTSKYFQFGTGRKR